WKVSQIASSARRCRWLMALTPAMGAATPAIGRAYVAWCADLRREPVAEGCRISRVRRDTTKEAIHDGNHSRSVPLVRYEGRARARCRRLGACTDQRPRIRKRDR